MCGFGFSYNLQLLFPSYLSNREQFVEYGRACSATYKCTSGVPQGSVLGTFLFLLFVNDVVCEIHNSKILLYADNIKIYKSVLTKDDCDMLQADLNRLVEWSDNNLLRLSSSKCEAIRFTSKKRTVHYIYKIKKTRMWRVQQVKDLGIIIDT